MTGVHSMLQSQLDRHRAVWEAFVAVRDSSKAELEQEVGGRARLVASPGVAASRCLLVERGHPAGRGAHQCPRDL